MFCLVDEISYLTLMNLIRIALLIIGVTTLFIFLFIIYWVKVLGTTICFYRRIQMQRKDIHQLVIWVGSKILGLSKSFLLLSRGMFHVCEAPPYMERRIEAPRSLTN